MTNQSNDCRFQWTSRTQSQHIIKNYAIKKNTFSFVFHLLLKDFSKSKQLTNCKLKNCVATKNTLTFPNTNIDRKLWTWRWTPFYCTDLPFNLIIFGSSKASSQLFVNLQKKHHSNLQQYIQILIGSNYAVMSNQKLRNKKWVQLEVGFIALLWFNILFIGWV